MTSLHLAMQSRDFSAVKIENFFRIILIILIFLLAEALQSMFWSNNKEICITLFPHFHYVKVGLKGDSIHRLVILKIS